MQKYSWVELEHNTEVLQWSPLNSSKCTQLHSTTASVGALRLSGLIWGLGSCVMWKLQLQSDWCEDAGLIEGAGSDEIQHVTWSDSREHLSLHGRRRRAHRTKTHHSGAGGCNDIYRQQVAAFSSFTWHHQHLCISCPPKFNSQHLGQ